MKRSTVIVGLFSLMLFVSVTTSNALVHIKPKPIKTPNDLTYVFGSTGNNLTWQYEASETQDIPGTYSVTIDGSALMGQTSVDWEDFVDIVVNVDGLTEGSHTIVISVTDHKLDDTPALTATDNVIVTVTADSGSNSSSVSSDASTTSSTSVSTSTSDSSMVSSTTPSSDSSTVSSTTPSSDSSTPSSTSEAVIPLFAMLFAIMIGVPILKYKDFKK